MSIEVMKQALEYIERHAIIDGIPVRNALRQAIEQAEQATPFGYLWPTGMHPEFRYTQQLRNGVEGTPVYTHPTAPEQPEPVAWFAKDDLKLLQYGMHPIAGQKTADDDLPLYLHPPTAPAASPENVASSTTGVHTMKAKTLELIAADHEGLAQFWRERSRMTHNELMRRACIKAMRKHLLKAQWMKQRAAIASTQGA